MAAAAALIESTGSAVSAAGTVIDQFNTWFGGVEEVEDKTRYLQITVVNMSSAQRLVMEDNYFDSGRFWSQPFGSIMPGSAATFFVCNKDGSVFTGVSGGVGMRVYDVEEGSEDPFEDGDGNGWWICTFSNPFSGSNKCLTRWKDFGIAPLWDEMDNDNPVYDTRCGCYRKDDKHFVFLWKDPDAPW